MGKVSRYLVLIVVAGAAVVGFWVYQKYFKDTGSPEVVVTVERGDIEELIRARGEVVPSSEYNLEFASAGIVNAVYVKEGDEVAAGAPLMKLDTGELVLEAGRIVSLVNQRAADLARLTAGATAVDVAVYEAKVASAATALHEAEKAEILALRAAFTAMDDAVKGTTDLFYSNPRSSQPLLSFSTSDYTMENTLRSERITIGAVLDRAAAAAAAADQSDLHAVALQMQADVQQVGKFLDDNMKALNMATGVSAASIDTWQSSVAAARTALNTKAAALAVAEETRTAALAALAVAQNELAAKRSPSRAEDINAAKAAVSEAESQIKIVEEKIRKATLKAPAGSRVVKVGYKAGEAFRSGSPAVILHALVPKVRSDISELDIVGVRERDGNPVRMTFDALPGTVYTGRVTDVEPQKVEKDGDTYYRVNFSIEDAGALIRPGMTADVHVVVSHKTGVLKIPEYVTYERDGKTYVRVERDGGVQEAPVELGISDGESREVISGLSEGERVFVPLE